MMGARFVGVYADDALGVLHPGQVLGGAGDADVYDDVGLDGAAALAYLQLVRQPAAVHEGARAGEHAAYPVRKAAHEFQVLLLFYAAAAGHDDLGVLEPAPTPCPCRTSSSS